MAEGVAQHSDFRTDPWARLAGTLRSYLRIVYGTGAEARAEIRRLNALHRAVVGPVHDEPSATRFGTAYSARDPVLSLWVHATLIDATLATIDAWLEPLPPGRRAAFYAETLPVGRLFGVPDALLPQDIDAFDAYVGGMLAPGGPVHPTATARELALAILRPPLGPLARNGPVADALGPAAAPVGGRPGPGAAGCALVAHGAGDRPPAAGDPGRVRSPVGRAGAGPRGVAGHGMARMAAAAAGPALRWFPQALAADARIAARAETAP